MRVKTVDELVQRTGMSDPEPWLSNLMQELLDLAGDDPAKQLKTEELCLKAMHGSANGRMVKVGGSVKRTSRLPKNAFTERELELADKLAKEIARREKPAAEEERRRLWGDPEPPLGSDVDRAILCSPALAILSPAELSDAGIPIGFFGSRRAQRRATMELLSDPADGMAQVRLRVHWRGGELNQVRRVPTPLTCEDPAHRVRTFLDCLDDSKAWIGKVKFLAADYGKGPQNIPVLEGSLLDHLGRYALSRRSALQSIIPDSEAALVWFLLTGCLDIPPVTISRSIVGDLFGGLEVLTVTALSFTAARTVEKAYCGATMRRGRTGPIPNVKRLDAISKFMRHERRLFHGRQPKSIEREEIVRKWNALFPQWEVVHYRQLYRAAHAAGVMS